MLENCKRLICSPSLNKVYCIVLYWAQGIIKQNSKTAQAHYHKHYFGASP